MMRRKKTGKTKPLRAQRDFRADFKKSGAFLEGHFVLSSGLHSSAYVQCAKALESPRLAGKLCRALAKKWRAGGGGKIDCVVGPALGGIVVAYELARALGCRALFMERVEGKLTLRRGFALEAGERVLVSEDVVTTGGSAQETIMEAERLGARVVGVAALVDRGGGRSFGKPFVSLLNLQPPIYDPAECPLCKRGIPAEKPGSRTPAGK
ncbi:MAG: orotate phosphoribosyltransferase [Planctomycetota bacterium]|nr:orotate phosphoribosyltransferase [Planctomycetota bacterium]